MAWKAAPITMETASRRKTRLNSSILAIDLLKNTSCLGVGEKLPLVRMNERIWGEQIGLYILSERGWCSSERDVEGGRRG
jgi:hypothetical protein